MTREQIIVALLALGLAGSTGWAAFHYAVRFLWPEAGLYAAGLSVALYALGFAPQLRRDARRVLTACMFGCILYIGWLTCRGGATFPQLAKIGFTIVYLFVIRYFVDRSFERGLRKVLWQIRHEGPSRAASLGRWILGCIACLGAIGICAKFIVSHEYHLVYGVLILAVPVLGCLLIALCAMTVIPLFEFLGIFIPAPEYQPRTTPKPSEIFTTGRPATLAQLDAAARGGASNGVPPLRFKD